MPSPDYPADERPPVKILFNRLIFQGEAGTRTANCCFPAIARSAEGALYATWRVGSQKESADGAIWCSTSSDNGLTWLQPRELFPPYKSGIYSEPHYAPLTVLDDGALLAAIMWVERSTPELPLFNPATDGILPLRTEFRKSVDNGCSWRTVSELSTTPYHGPLAITGPVLQLPDGRLAAQFEVNKAYDDTRPWRHAAALKFSTDGGRTWPRCVEVANDPTGRLFYWDARTVVTGQANCMAAFWTYDRTSNQDRHVHLAYSDDLGQSWSRPRESTIVGQVTELVPLDNSRLLLIVVDRFKTRSIRAHLSSDGGQTFADDAVIYEQPTGAKDAGSESTAADYLQDMTLWTFGRVQAAADNAGNVWVVYYAGDTKRTCIFCARLAL